MAENIVPVRESDVNISNRGTSKSLSRIVCSCLSQMGDNTLVLQMLEKIILDQMGERRKARYIDETETAKGVQHSREIDEITPNSEMDSFAFSSFNSSNFHHSQATDGTNLNNAQTS
ncbi:hypothetical protein C1H46_006399 [Malus baccata]|uniref:Uncharacterized protein n=1 Tax=Malus baccata TaxID=106549 RepID=A0A540NAA8_MALBA|nr:hypothetical protein C1H46_006399 [Malus baccata]